MINIVLYEPEIPENTGNIMRTCAGTNSKLHLIEPLGFILDEKRIKRSGVNYIDKVHYQRYIDFDDFKNKNKGEYYYFTRYGTKAYSEIDFSDKNKNLLLHLHLWLFFSLYDRIESVPASPTILYSFDPYKKDRAFFRYSISEIINRYHIGTKAESASLDVVLNTVPETQIIPSEILSITPLPSIADRAAEDYPANLVLTSVPRSYRWKSVLRLPLIALLFFLRHCA